MKKTFQILITDNSGIHKIAAEEFASFHSRITGILPEITTSPAENTDLVILAGDSDSRFVFEREMDGTLAHSKARIGSDDYELLSGNWNGRTLLRICGGNKRALLYGVYRFFELAAGCRYFWDGDLIPHKDSLELSGWNLYESPRFEYRGLRYFAHRGLHRFQAEHWTFDDWRRELDFLLKKRFNLFMLRIGLDDLFQKAFPDEVRYPEGFEMDGSVPRSYDDHTLFMPLRDRGRLRKQILDYAFARGLMHPEDVGTMTHWYSRTPMDFIRAFKPDFLPQVSGIYSEPTGQVWDIRKDENLERYYQLTQAHIRHYGSPQIFHTIGLSERQCFKDHESNHKLKLYAYNRIIGRLRKDYPDAPLLISSWEFLNWTVEEVRDLMKNLNGTNTIILDYIADIQDERNCFIHWNVEGKRKWIFGIFHSNEYNSEVRGNYPLIGERLERAAADPMCIGMVLWPETAHADTLMLEYLAANAWDPVHSDIDKFVETFCEARHPDCAETMLELWRMVLPSIKRRIRYGFTNKDASALMWFIRPLTLYGALTLRIAERYQNTLEQFTPLLRSVRGMFGKLAATAEGTLSAFAERDLLDLVKSLCASVMDTAFAAVNTGMENWRNGAGNAARLRQGMADFREAYQLLADILKSSPEFSLYDSLERLKKIPGSNPDFEATLKGNADNTYSRTFIPEIIEACSIPEFDVFRSFAEQTLESKIRRPWVFPKTFDTECRRIQDIFYRTPLKELAPDCAAFRAALPENLRRFGAVAEKLMIFADLEYQQSKQEVRETVE